MSPKTRSAKKALRKSANSPVQVAKPASGTRSNVAAPITRPKPKPPLQRPAEAKDSEVTLHLLNGPSYSITPPADFDAMAMYWEYVLRNRIRWSQDEEASESVTHRALQVLKRLGLDQARLAEIARSGVVEIDIPYTSSHEEIGWELRVFPWEFLLFTGTAKLRTSPLIVTRHVCCKDRPEITHHSPKKLLVVESAPGKFRDMYSFSSERKLVESNLMLEEVACPRNPTLHMLKQLVDSGQADVVHLAGIDSHQGEQLLHHRDANLWDGYLIADPSGNPTYATAEQLAEALRGKKGHGPALVSCNFWNSAARVAALIAAEASVAAIGFQDEIDDRVAENFFAKFYFNYRAMNWDLLRAYRLAVGEIHFGGAIVVLWSSRSLLPTVEQKPLQADADQLRTMRQELAKRDIPKDADPQEVLDVVIKLRDMVNYSLLQNNEDLFEEFSIRKLQDGTARDVGVELNLFVGGDSFPYRTQRDVKDSYVPLAKEIRFPLTSSLMRSLRESVNSVIAIKVTWGERVVYLDTKPIKLLAIDEWMDTPELDAYLPSFVFPRDRAVARIIDSAQKYLMALNDDASAGFDGYQSVDRRAKDPYSTVDLQARAIWAALSYDLPLSYVNPPPSFTASSQRLRTPSDVVDGKRGTCIDLALLMAACLEYAGIYPLIFLLNDHAFPGYWRSDESRQKFIDLSSKQTFAMWSTIKSTDLAEGASKTPLSEGASRAPSKPWVFTNYVEVLQLARQGDIVPIETIWLTQHQGFWDAVDGGMDDLRSKREFASMIDVQGARSYRTPVTPLPILQVTS
jgi:hypothetical protein